MRSRVIRKAGAAVAVAHASPALLPQTAPQALRAPRELWLAAHLPHLALEALLDEAEERPACVAAVALEARAQYVVAVDEHAARAGVRAGMSLAAALALAPRLLAKPRDLHREQALLTRLARLAQRFTPRVSLAPPDGLLLEVKGSLQLFGGAAGLYRSFRAACAAAGARPLLALAPTALAALAGARTGRPFRVLDDARLIGALTAVPLAALRWPPEVLERLAKLGVQSVGEALRLPRAGFARRFGPEQLQLLDRLAGRDADLRASFNAAERFHMRRSFTYELTQHETILGALAPLLEALGKFLALRQCGITALECRLQHRHAPSTCCVLKLTVPTAHPQRLRALLGERLALLALPEPVRSCELSSGELVSRAFCSDSLWQPGEHGGGVSVESSDLVERLRARLGVQAVHGLEVNPTHRPEVASRHAELEMQPPLRATQTPPRTPSHTRQPPCGLEQPAAFHGHLMQLPPWPAFRRPMWLLPLPQLLQVSAGRPHRRGPLRLLGEPERLETGWWEREEVARDYYQALDARGARLWIYREREAPHRWFLHGVFG